MKPTSDLPEVPTEIPARPVPRRVTPFRAAALDAVADPATAPFERHHRQEPAQFLQMEFLDVFTAGQTTVRGTNRIRTSGPALLCLEGVYQNRGGTQEEADFGVLDWWVTVEDTPLNDALAIIQSGSYFYLPQAGVYYLKAYPVATPIFGALNDVNIRVFARVIGGVDRDLAQAMLASTKPNLVMSASHGLPAATLVALRPPTIMAYWGVGVPFGSTSGKSLRFTRVTLSNPAGTVCYFTVGDKTLVAGAGHSLATNGSITLPLSPGSTVYGLNTAGAFVEGCWELI